MPGEGDTLVIKVIGFTMIGLTRITFFLVGLARFLFRPLGQNLTSNILLWGVGKREDLAGTPLLSEVRNGCRGICIWENISSTGVARFRL